MGQTKEQREHMEERRRRVARFLRTRLTQDEIAAELGVTRRTIISDVKAIREMWRKEMVEDPVALRTQELADLEQMERECVVQYSLTRERGWITERRQIKERRSKMLGLDAPAKQEHSGPDGGPLKQEVTFITDALDNPDTRDALDALSQRLEGHASSNGRHVV